LASYQQLQDDVCNWLNRRDIISLIPGWVLMVETELAETLRARPMVTFGTQAVDAAYITMPVDFAAMESIRDATTGELLILKDEWSGSWTQAYMPHSWNVYSQLSMRAPATAYRLLADCIEFLPHPTIPNPPDPNWLPQQVLMGWYAKPKPLVLPADTNAILEQFYGIYLFGTCKYGALFELDDDRAAQMDGLWQQVITRANLWKQGSDYSGAPFREEMALVF
jgi:hypothetical protein